MMSHYDDDHGCELDLRNRLRDIVIEFGIVADQEKLDDLYATVHKANSEQQTAAQQVARFKEANTNLVRFLVSILLTVGGKVEVPPENQILPTVDGYTVGITRTGPGELFQTFTLQEKDPEA